MFQKAPNMPPRSAAAFVLLLLVGCDIPGISPDPRVVQRDADAKAVGGACRHAMRGLEDCYTLNPKAPKASVFNGWKEMDSYMRENKIDGSPSLLGKAVKPEKPERPDPSIETEMNNSHGNRS
ncbi:MAG: hypothetical protein K2Q11_01580 [Burkholderiaceae bacterium]|nr:hypothetical protein [Burkholderiaceae bacterium]